MTARKHHDDAAHQEIERLRAELITRFCELTEGKAQCTVLEFAPPAATALHLIVRTGTDEALSEAMPVLVDQVAGVLRTELQPLLITTTHPSKEPAMSVPPDEEEVVTTATGEPDTDEQDSEVDSTGETEEEETDPVDEQEEEDDEEDEEEEDEDDGEEPSNEDEDDEDEDEDDDEDDEDDEDEDIAEGIQDIHDEIAELKKLLKGRGKACITRAEAEALIAGLREDLAEEGDEHDEKFWRRMRAVVGRGERQQRDDDEDEMPRKTYTKLAKGLRHVFAKAVEPVRFSIGEFTLRR